jgi:hypothetical protein
VPKLKQIRHQGAPWTAHMRAFPGWEGRIGVESRIIPPPVEVQGRYFFKEESKWELSKNTQNFFL